MVILLDQRPILEWFMETGLVNIYLFKLKKCYVSQRDWTLCLEHVMYTILGSTLNTIRGTCVVIQSAKESHLQPLIAILHSLQELHGHKALVRSH